MPKCGKIGAAFSAAGWGAGAAIFSSVGKVVQSSTSFHCGSSVPPQYRYYRMLGNGSCLHPGRGANAQQPADGPDLIISATAEHEQLSTYIYIY